MNWQKALVFSVGTLLIAAFQNLDSVSNLPIPDIPAKLIDTRTIQLKQGSSTDLEFMAPQIPVLRMSGDGRLGLNLESGEILYLLKPELLNGHFSKSGKGVAGLLGDQKPTPTKIGARYASSAEVRGLVTPDGKPLTFERVTGSVLCEPTYMLASAGRKMNPYVCSGDKDCYDFKIVNILYFTYPDASGTGTKEMITLAALPARAEVSSPKTARAAITKFELVGPPTVNRVLTQKYGFENMMELNVVGDGRLAVSRVGYYPLKWIGPQGSQRFSDNVDIVYSVYDPQTNDDLCDVLKWNDFYPISHAPYDSTNKMPSRFGLAFNKFRDPMGNLIPDGADIYGAYPWVDRAASNLMFTGINSTFYRSDSAGNVVPRYPESSALRPMLPSEIASFEDRSRTMGLTVLGLWTQGKMVLLDGLLNNADFGIRFFNPSVQDRKLNIYRPTRVGDADYVMMGAGRERGFLSKPEGMNAPTGYFGNGSHIEAYENKFLYNSNLTPGTPRDVVWYVGNSRTTQEVAFDHYINPNILISSGMVGAMELRGFEPTNLKLGASGKEILSNLNAPPPGYIKPYYLSYKDGSSFFDYRFSELAPAEVLVQNEASTPERIFKVPPAGSPVPVGSGRVRIEPVAMGGVYGKGLWLDGFSGVQYVLPVDNPNLAISRPWYIGLFVDWRTTTPTPAYATLFEIKGANGVRTRVALRGGDKVALLREQADKRFLVTRSIDLALTNLNFAPRRWTHLGFLSNADQTQITVLMDGFPLGQWSQVSGNPFPIQGGAAITLGRPDAAQDAVVLDGQSSEVINGFRGWVDDFRVMGYTPTWEEMCNEARGTLVELTINKYWRDRSMLYPAFGQKLIQNAIGRTTDQLACVTNNNNIEPLKLTSLADLPDGVTSIRKDFIFPKSTGGLVFDQPRPDSSGTQFCLSCHTADLKSHSKLSLSALVPTLSTDNKTLLNMQWDKRQPMQPYRAVWGTFRESIVNPVANPAPKAPDTTSVEGQRSLIDRYLRP